MKLFQKRLIIFKKIKIMFMVKLNKVEKIN